MSDLSDEERIRISDVHYQNGLTLFRKNLFREAILEFDEAIKINQSNRSAYNDRGLSYGYLGNHEMAITDLTTAIELDPKQVGAYATRGIEFTRLEKYSEAIADFTTAIDITPTSFQLLVLRAMAYFDFGDYARAIRDYGWAIELNSKDASIFVRRANIHSMRSMYELADNDFSFAIRIKPDFADAYFGRGLIYCREGLIEQGMGDLRKFLELTSNSPGYTEMRNYANGLLTPLQENAKGWCVDCLQIHLKNFRHPSCTFDIQVPRLKNFSVDYPSLQGNLVALSGRQFPVFANDNKVILDYFTPEEVDIAVRWNSGSLQRRFRPLYQVATPNGRDKLPFCKIGIVVIDFLQQ